MNLRRLAATTFTAAVAFAVIATGMLAQASNKGTSALNSAQQASTMAATGSAVQATTGYLRVVNASTDAGRIDIYLSGAPIVKFLDYGKGTDFIALPAASYTIDIRAGGAAMTDPVLATVSADLTTGDSVDLVAVGLVKATPSTFAVDTFTTDRSATDGKARIEVIHASADAGAVDVLSAGKPVISNLAFGKSSGDTLLDLDPGSYDFTVTATGTTTPALITLKGTNLSADTIYTIVAIGSAAKKSIKPLVLTSTSPEMQAAATMQATAAATAAK